MEIKAPLELLRKNKLFLATPQYGGMAGGLYTKSVANLTAMCTHHHIPLQHYFLMNESLITRARNYACDEFLRSDAQHLMFIDADISFEAQDVLALMSLQAQDEKYDVIGGPYPKKAISWEKIKMAVDKGFADEDPQVLDRFVGDYVFNPKNGQTQIRIDEPAEVLEIGTGFMMISRKAFEKFDKHFGDRYKYRPDHVRTEHFDGSRLITQYFQAEIDKFDSEPYYRDVLQKITEYPQGFEGDMREMALKALQHVDEQNKKKSLRYLSEDYWWCQRLADCGARTWLCPWMKLQHQGTMIFGGSLADLAALGAPATASPEMLKKKVKAQAPIQFSTTGEVPKIPISVS